MNELASMNQLLKSIGVRPVAALTSDHPDAIDARSELERVRRAFQTKGWWFNRIYNVEHQLDLVSQIKLSSSTLAFSLTDARDTNDYPYLTRRGEFVYDNYRNTRIFTHSLYFTIHDNVPWDDMPESAQEHCMYSAMSDFIDIKVEDTQRSLKAEGKAIQALANVNKEELDTNNVNMFTNPRAHKLKRGVRPFRFNNTNGR